MKKIIILVIISLFLFSGIAYASYKYNSDKIINMIKGTKNIVELNPMEFVAYLEYHTADRDKDHISYYLSTFWLRPDPETVALTAIAFIKEEWDLEDEIWTIKRYVASDRFVIGEITRMDCGSLKEKLDGQVLEFGDLNCPSEQSLVEEVILKVSSKTEI